MKFVLIISILSVTANFRATNHPKPLARRCDGIIVQNIASHTTSERKKRAPNLTRHRGIFLMGGYSQFCGTLLIVEYSKVTLISVIWKVKALNDNYIQSSYNHRADIVIEISFEGNYREQKFCTQ